MLFVKRFFKNLRKISKIISYSRNGEEEVVIEFKTATIELSWYKDSMDVVFTIGGKRENYRSSDIPDYFKSEIGNIINSADDIKAKLRNLDSLLHEWVISISSGNYATCSIWDIGPARPYDNLYALKSISKEKDKIEIVFEDAKCQIINPIDVKVTYRTMKIKSASKIIWEGIYYEKESSQNSVYVDQFEPIGDKEIKVTTSGAVNKEHIFEKKKGNAFTIISSVLFEMINRQ